METITRIDFVEDNRQWLVTLIAADGSRRPGEPFPASGSDNFPKLQQVLDRLKELGYRSTHTPYGKPNKSEYRLDVLPL